MPLGVPLRGRVRHALDNPFTRNIDPTLVLDLPFSEGVGDIAHDRSLYGNPGVIHGASWVDGKIGKALNFDGINDYVEIPDSLTLNFGSGDFSVFMWIKTSGYPSIGKYGSAADVGWIFFGTSTLGHDGELVVSFTDTARHYVEFFSGVAVNDGVYHFIGFVRSSNLCRVYIDGVLVKTEDISSIGSISSTSTVLIGAMDSDAMGDFYKGIIDEVRAYNRALTDAEIQLHYNEGK